MCRRAAFALMLAAWAAACTSRYAAQEPDASATDASTADVAVEADVIADAGAVDADAGDAPGDASPDRLPLPPSDPFAVNPCGQPDGGRCGGGTACCAGFPVSGGNCIPTTDGCNYGAGDTGLAHVFCDEKADCMGQLRCCYSTNGAGTVGGTCAVSCGTAELCRTDQECGASGCFTWPCPRGPVLATCGGEAFDASVCW
jgi:hypothetical protein